MFAMGSLQSVRHDEFSTREPEVLAVSFSAQQLMAKLYPQIMCKHRRSLGPWLSPNSSTALRGAVINGIKEKFQEIMSLNANDPS